MFDPIVWVGAIVVGISLGLLGSGGSILTVPLLVYVAKEPEKLAIAQSLLIVGVVALVGSISHLLKQNVKLRLVMLFGLPSMAAAFLGAHLSQYISAQIQLMTFAVVMAGASILMLRPIKADPLTPAPSENVLALVLAGIAVGVLAGIVGVGGGFLIVPALLLIAHTPIKNAIATSLVIIALQSLSGFSKYALYYAKSEQTFNWPLILLVSSCALLGVFVGTWISEKLPQQTLKRLFGLALIPLSIFIFYSNL